MRAECREQSVPYEREQQSADTVPMRVLMSAPMRLCLMLLMCVCRTMRVPMRDSADT